MPRPQLLLLLVFCMGFSLGCPDGKYAKPEGEPILPQETSSKLLTLEARQTINSHKQLYDKSSIPMAIEMVLKLTKHAAPDFYDLQNAWTNKTDGGFSDFDGKTIKGLTFHQQFGQPQDKDFPLEQFGEPCDKGFPFEKLFATIDEELTAGRYVIISLIATKGLQTYVICDKDKDGEFIALSKADAITISNNHVKRTVTEMKGTDILTYEVK